MNVKAVVRRSVATPDASVVPALHWTGDKARPVTASFGQDFSHVRVHTRSAAVVRRASEGAIDLGGLVMEGLADSEPRPIVQTMRKEVSVSRQVVSVQRHPCPPYDGYSAAVALTNYNCTGLAHRTYDRKNLANTKPLLSAGVQCAPGKVKHWLWEYDMHAEDDVGTPQSPTVHDFHTVAGVIRPDGADPVDVYTKNGKRRVYGPGTGPSFRPPAREPMTSDDPDEKPVFDKGKPVFKVRANYATMITCLNCPSQTPPQQGPPPP